jgi:hypothetical protein
MTEKNENKLFGDNIPIVQSDGVSQSFPIPDSVLEAGQTFQAVANLTLSDGSLVSTNAIPFQTPGVALVGESCLTENISVTVQSVNGSNVYFFNGASSLSASFKMNTGTYFFYGVPQSHPIAFYSTNQNLTVSGENNHGQKTGADGIIRSYYYGTVIVSVFGDFQTISYDCYHHGYMGGQNNLSFDPTCPLPQLITTTTLAPGVDDTDGETTTTTLRPLSINVDVISDNMSYALIYANRHPVESNRLFSKVRVYWSLKDRENSTHYEEDDFIFIPWGGGGVVNSIIGGIVSFTTNNNSRTSVSLNEENFDPGTTYEFHARAYYKDSPDEYIESDIFEVTTPGTPTTTSTTTTTDSPENVLISIDDLDNCPCGITTVPAGSFHDGEGLKIMISDDNTEHHVDLLHDSEILIRREEELVTVSNFITEHITPKNIALYINSSTFMRWEIENEISVTVRSRDKGVVLAKKSFGYSGSKYRVRGSSLIDKPSVAMISLSDIDLFNDALVVQISSVCDYKKIPCRDSLPATIRTSGSGTICLPLDDYYSDIEYITTTSPPVESVVFSSGLSATVNADTNLITFCAVAESSFGSDINYFLEMVDGNCYKRLTNIEETKSKEKFCITNNTLGINDYRISVYSPNRVTSSVITVDNPAPDIKGESERVYTTAPPIPAPSLQSISFNPNPSDNLSYSWNLLNDPSEISTVAMFYGPKGNARSNSFILYSGVDGQADYNFTQLTSGHKFNTSNVNACAEYEGFVSVKSNDDINHNIDKYFNSNIISFVTAQIPTSVRSLVISQNSTTVNVSWQAPAYDGGCPDLFYIVDYKEKGGAIDWTAHKYTTDNYTSTTTSITGLDASKEYFVRVAAHTLAGTSPFVSNAPGTQMLVHFEDLFVSELTRGASNNALVQAIDSSAYGRHITLFGGCNVPSNLSECISSGVFTSEGAWDAHTENMITASAWDEEDQPTAYLGRFCPLQSTQAYYDYDEPKYLAWESDNFQYISSTSSPNTYFYPMDLTSEGKPKCTIEFWMYLYSVDKTSNTNATFGEFIELAGKWDHSPHQSAYVIENASTGGEYDSWYVSCDLDYRDATIDTHGGPVLWWYYNSTMEFPGYPIENGTWDFASATSTVSQTNPAFAKYAFTETGWHHIAFVFDEDKNNATDDSLFSIYVDGQRIISTAPTYNNPDTNVPTYLTHSDMGLDYMTFNYLWEYYTEANTCFKIDELRIKNGLPYENDSGWPSSFSVPTDVFPDDEE